MSKLTEDEIRLDICADERGLRWVLVSDKVSGIQCKVSGDYSISQAKERALRIINEEIRDAAEKGIQQEEHSEKHSDGDQGRKEASASESNSDEYGEEGQEESRKE